LDYIVGNGGTILEAVSTQVWSGDAAVHVSIVNWVKGTAAGPKMLFTQLGDRLDSPWRIDTLDHINSSLSSGMDVSQAASLRANRESQACYQGQTHGHKAFLLPAREAQGLIEQDSHLADVLFPYLAEVRHGFADLSDFQISGGTTIFVCNRGF